MDLSIRGAMGRGTYRPRAQREWARAMRLKERTAEPHGSVFSRSLARQLARARADLDPAVVREAIKVMQEAEAVFGRAAESADTA